MQENSKLKIYVRMISHEELWPGSYVFIEHCCMEEKTIFSLMLWFCHSHIKLWICGLFWTDLATWNLYLVTNMKPLDTLHQHLHVHVKRDFLCLRYIINIILIVTFTFTWRCIWSKDEWKCIEILSHIFWNVYENILGCKRFISAGKRNRFRSSTEQWTFLWTGQCLY